MSKKKFTLLDRILLYPESLIVSLGLIFVAVIILAGVFWDGSSEAFESPLEGQSISQEERTGSVIIDINSAGIQELKKVNGIGDELASRIVRYREEHGPFQSVEELVNVKGIGKVKLDEIRYYLTCSSATESSD